MTNSKIYHGFRFPLDIIRHMVWRYCRFALSFRGIEELVASRGIIASDETIRQWTWKFGQGFANELRRRQPKRGDKWHLNDGVRTIKGSTITCGVQSSRMAVRSISPCRAGVTGRQRNAFSASF